MSTQKKFHQFYQWLSSRREIIFLLLTVISAGYVLHPLQDFQYFLSPGDHGRELYCFKKAMDGALPYQDYSWLYGPLFLYYFAFFYHLFGVSIQSVLLGQNILILGISILIYLICSRFLSPAMAYICALWYLAYRGMEFFYSYHQSGGIFLILVVLFSVFEYIKKNNRFPLYTGFSSIFLLLLTRLNMGIAIFVAFLTALLVIDQSRNTLSVRPSKKLYLLCSVLTLAPVALLYWWLLYPLPQYALGQTFPYSSSQLTINPINPVTPAKTILQLFSLLFENFNASWPRKILGLALLTSLLQTLTAAILRKKETPSKEMILAFISLFVFLLLTLHEFVRSGVFFRLNWAFPVLLIIFAHLFSEFMRINSVKIFTPVIKTLTLVLFCCFIFRQIDDNHRFIASHKTPGRLLKTGTTNIYTTQDAQWFTTVDAALNYLRHNVPPGEKVFCLPHDSLYNFLSGHDAPTRQLAFFEHTMITPEQEQQTIHDLEKNRVEWAVISNRIESVEFGMGVFGTTHCRLLNDYLTEHFEVAAQFGNWNGPGGWGADHATAILKRKS